MKRILAAVAAIAALAAFAGQAGAADLARRQQMPVKAPYMEQIYNWTGFYLGINGGGAWGRSNWDTLGNIDISGGTVGGTVGYNYQVNQAVFGVEGDINWSDIKGSAGCGVGINCQTQNEWLGTARARVGYAFDRIMPYVTGGAAFGNIKATQTGLPSTDDTKVGWTLGGGVEAAFAPNWSAKIEYLYVDLGHLSCGAVSCGVPTNVDFRTSLVRGGVNYRF